MKVFIFIFLFCILTCASEDIKCTFSCCSGAECNNVQLEANTSCPGVLDLFITCTIGGKPVKRMLTPNNSSCTNYNNYSKPFALSFLILLFVGIFLFFFVTVVVLP